jgi:hypothetical protein
MGFSSSNFGFSAGGSSGGGGGTVNKYDTSVAFVANVTQTITHNLGTDTFNVQLFDDSTGNQIVASYNNITSTNIDIVLTQSYASVTIVIIG